ncbi:MAG: EamA/RhaT family transporter [Owenweeksia sp.]|nr:EamA/RhaT family transporter [Owenweeksia sp.]
MWIKYGSQVQYCWDFYLLVYFSSWREVAQKYGVAAVSVAVKMSLIIPVIFAVIHYGESLGILKVLGILMALAAVYFATKKPRVAKPALGIALLPLLLFLGSGFLDSFLKYNQQELVPTAEQGSFVSFSFLMAGFIGIIWYLAVWLLQKKTPAFKSIWGGIALGIPNYGSIYFLIKSLDMPDLESSLIFPVNNVGIVTLSVICAKFLFTEKLSVANWMGIILALLSITLMSIANFIL